MQETHAWQTAGNTCLAKCWKYMDWPKPKSNKKGGLVPFLLYIICGQSIHIQHLAKHRFPAFGQACVSCI